MKNPFTETIWAIDETWAAQLESLAGMYRQLSDAGLSEKRDPLGNGAENLSSAPAGAPGMGPGASVPRGLAVIPVDGILFNADERGFFGTGYGAIRQEIEQALADKSVRAILLDIDSPGGAVAGVQELADFIAEAAARKPMAAFTNSLMASAAYWLGASTGRVYATETSVVGSIGVIMTLWDRRRLTENLGVKVHVITSGRFKKAGHPDVELEEGDRAYFQAQLDAVHAVFKRQVQERMQITQPPENWAEAQVLLGASAKEAGLLTSVVSGRQAALEKLLQETVMNADELKTQFPEASEALRTQGFDAGYQAGLEAAAKEAKPFDLEGFLAVMKPFMPEASFAEARNFLEKTAALGLSAEQIQGMAALIHPEQPAPSAQSSNRRPYSTPEIRQDNAAILSSLQALLPPRSGVQSSAAADAAMTPDELMLSIANRKAGD